MSNLNKVLLLGRLGKDPEIKNFDNGGSIASFSLATSRHWKDKQGQKQEATDWHNIVFNGPLVDVISKYVHKGDLLLVEGMLRTRKWEKDGQTNYVTEVVGSNMQLMPKASNQNQSEGAKPASPFNPAAKEEDDGLPW